MSVCKMCCDEGFRDEAKTVPCICNDTYERDIWERVNAIICREDKSVASEHPPADARGEESAIKLANILRVTYGEALALNEKPPHLDLCIWNHLRAFHEANPYEVGK